MVATDGGVAAMDERAMVATDEGVWHTMWSFSTVSSFQLSSRQQTLGPVSQLWSISYYSLVRSLW